MSKVHTAYRVVKTRLGSAYIHPVKAYDNPQVAEKAVHEMSAGLAAVAEGTILVKTPQGPRAVMTVWQFLHELGIEGWSHSVLSQDVHGAIVLTPSPIISAQ